MGKFLTDDAMYTSARNLVADAEKAVANLREASAEARAAVTDFRGENGPMKGIAGGLQQTLASAKDAMADLAENTEALKRNFFFRGFFNRRGYFDLDKVSLQQYRARCTRNRRPPRVADLGRRSRAVRARRKRQGTVERTRTGSARLGDVVVIRYPRDSPFVVEGYAQEVTGDQRFLLSRARAKLVRDYVVARFSLDSNYVTTMAMGEEAEGSPSGNRWDGVALALFVATSAM